MKKINFNKNDFELCNLPVTRRKQFSDVFKNRLGIIVKLALLSLLFFLPIIIYVLLKDFYLISLATSLSNERFEIAYQTTLIFNPIFIGVGVLIYSIGLCGILNVLKRLLWAEPIFFFQDFKDGIKSNIGQTLIIDIAFIIFLWLGKFVEFSLSDFSFVAYLFDAINIAIIFPCLFHFLFVNATYKNTFIMNIKRSFQLYIPKFFETLGFMLIFLTFYLLNFIEIYSSLLILKYVLLIVIGFIVLPLIFISFYEIELDNFDKMINKNNFVSIYKKGLFDPNRINNGVNENEKD